jgi:hypothetical protein
MLDEQGVFDMMLSRCVLANDVEVCGIQFITRTVQSHYIAHDAYEYPGEHNTVVVMVNQQAHIVHQQHTTA